MNIGKTSLTSFSLGKKISYSFILAIGILAIALSRTQAAEIKSFYVDLGLNQRGVLTVKEDIMIDFDKSRCHGILRFIPIVYHRNLGLYSIQPRSIAVSDGFGKDLSYSVSRNQADLIIKIGDANQFVSGLHSYHLEYQVEKAVNFFDGRPQLYWNVTGNQWTYNIHQCVVHFHPPAKVPIDQIQAECFVGSYGSKQEVLVSKNSDSITASSYLLMPGMGLTIVCNMPVGSVIRPTQWQALWEFVRDWLGLFIIPVIAGSALYFYWRWRGRDGLPISITSVEWTPPTELSPAEVGTLVDENCDAPDIVSTIVDLASRGYLKIKAIRHPGILLFSDRDYEFAKTAPPAGSPSLKEHEKLFLDGIFCGDAKVNYLSKLKGNFLVNVPLIKKAIWSSLMSSRMFFRNPAEDRQTFYFLAFLVFLFGFIVICFGGNENRANGLGLLVAAIIIVLSAPAMPARTAIGSQALARVKAFQRFIQTAEKQRIAVLAKDDPTIFGRLLPYAMVLGAADQWALAFKDLINRPPNWYDNSALSNNQVFVPNVFVGDLGHSLRTIQSGFLTPPLIANKDSWGEGAGGGFNGSSGNGFSGGGFGGGGGSTW